MALINTVTEGGNYHIDGKFLRLNGVDSQIACPACDKAVILRYKEAVLIKSRTIVIDGSKIVLRCRKCRNFVTIDNGKKLLTV